MPNTFAYVVFFAWPLVALVLFRRNPPALAASIAVVAGYLLLPGRPSFNFPLIPGIGKNALIGLSALGAAMIVARDHKDALPGLLPRHPVILGCLALLAVGAVGTVLTNGDHVVRNEGRVQTGLTFYDVGSMLSSTVLVLLSFLVGRKFLAGPRAHRTLLMVLLGAALLYALPALWEVRMSPQLNSQIYGFFPHDWRQHLRNDGFRPVVFLRHGLLLGLFLAMGVIAAAALWRIGAGSRRNTLLAGVAALFLIGTLVLSKNLGASLVALMGLTIVLLIPPRRWVLIAALVAGMVLTYPALRTAGLVPIEKVVTVLSPVVGSGRIMSFQFRLRHEDALLEKANRKPLFGWGRWGRARIYVDGRGVSTTDGAWIIFYGEGGAVGYLAFVGLLALPPILLVLRRREEDEAEDDDLATAALAVLLALSLIDLIPNAGLTPVAWLMAGALAGRLEWVRAEDEAPPGVGTAAPPRGGGRRLPYARRFPGAPPARAGVQAGARAAIGAQAEGRAAYRRPARAAAPAAASRGGLALRRDP